MERIELNKNQLFEVFQSQLKYQLLTIQLQRFFLFYLNKIYFFFEKIKNFLIIKLEITNGIARPRE